jgi:transcriptional regulator with XRE-family HTH domain
MDSMRTQRFSDQIRAAVDASGLTRYRICKTIGLSESSMSRFMAGKSGLSWDAVDRLAELLGLTVTTDGKNKTTK